MATSPLFGWEEPDDTDLVKDGAAAIRTLGNAIDTSMGDLLGGSSGQVLSKASGTNMDFTWVTPAGDIEGVTAGVGISGGGTSGTVTITNSMATAITTSGDLIKGTGSGTFDRLGIGSSGQVLTVSGGAPVWSSPAGGGKVLQVVQATTNTSTSISSTTLTDTTITATITPSSTSSKVLVMVAANSSLYRSGSSEIVVYAKAALLRGATNVLNYTILNGGGITGTLSEYRLRTQNPITYLDTPATTSATTYKIQGAVNTTTGSGNVTFQGGGDATSTIILMEIGA